MSSMDSRIPVLFAQPGEVIPPGSAVLVADHEAAPEGVVVVRIARGTPGFAACACCAPRGQVAQALGRLFFARARGEVGAFRQLVVAAPGLVAEVRAALAGDVLVAARYRFAGG